MKEVAQKDARMTAAQAEFSALERVPVGVCVLRSDWIVLFWNCCLEQWTKIPRSQILGTDIRERFPHLKQPKYANRLYEIFQGGPPTSFSSQLHKYLIPAPLPQGQWRTQHATVTSVPASDEVGYYALLSIQDVTDLTSQVQAYRSLRDQALAEVKERQRAEEQIKQLNEDLRRQTIELEAANKELEAFSYSVSHDLRAPLRAINGFSRILRNDYGPQLNPEARRYLQMVHDNAQQLGNLVDDLLTFSRLSRSALKKRLVMPTDIVHQVIADLMHEQQNRQVEISIGDLPAAQADPVLLKQVWVNLLANALKYTREREVAQIEVGYQPTESDRVYFVKDNGVGFDMQYVHKLFGVFQRLHRAEEYEGTGVGLAIVQRIIHRHGGRVWAAAEVNKGATFYFTL